MNNLVLLPSALKSQDHYGNATMSPKDVMLLKDAEGMPNSVDPDQTASSGVCTICLGLSVPKLRTINCNVL